MIRPAPRLLAALALAAFLAAPDARATPVAERAFIYQTLSVPTSVVNFLGTVFPESSAVGTSYLSSTFDPNLLVTEAATVTVTFVWEGAGYKNTLATSPTRSTAEPSRFWTGSWSSRTRRSRT